MRNESSVSTALLLCLELEQTLTRDGVSFTLITSRPGRDGTFERHWRNASGRLAADQALDLSTWAEKTIYQALERWGGIQGTLDGV